MKKWTKKAAKKRCHKDPLVTEAIMIEPALALIIGAAYRQRKVSGYHRIHRYYELKNQALPLVGWYAKNKHLRTQEFFRAVIGTIGDLLPPDEVDLEGGRLWMRCRW